MLGEHTNPIDDTPDFTPGKPRTWARRQGRGPLITMNPTDGNGHVLVLAASAGYKTSGIVIPNILHYDGPLVVFDPKGDLYARTKDARRAMGYSAVAIDAQNGFDPFKMIAPLAPQAPSVFHTMAKTLMPLKGRSSEVSEFFHDMSVSLFAALTAHFVRENEPNIARAISEFINRKREVVIRDAGKIAKDHEVPFIRDELRGLAALDDRTFPGTGQGDFQQAVLHPVPGYRQLRDIRAQSAGPSRRSRTEKRYLHFHSRSFRKGFRALPAAPDRQHVRGVGIARTT